MRRPIAGLAYSDLDEVVPVRWWRRLADICCSVPHCKAIQVNGNNVDWVTNARHLGNVVDNKLSDLKDINAKKGNFIASVNWLVDNFRGKLPIECYIRLFQSY